jgi:leukotriene-A4 hydrolase
VYTKGAWFLQFLEQRYGRAVFDPWLKGYFDHFAFQSITTAQFRDYLKANLVDKHPNVVTMAEVDAWLYDAGIPNAHPWSSRQVQHGRCRAHRLAGQQQPADRSSPTKPGPRRNGCTSSRHAGDDSSPSSWRSWTQAYRSPARRTARSRCAGIRWPNAAAMPRRAWRWASSWSGSDRRKLIMPVYKALVATPDGLAFAEQVFADAKPGYHPITTAAVEAVLNKPAATR